MSNRHVRLVVSVALAAACARPGANSGPATPIGATAMHRAVDDLTNVIVYDIMSPPQSSRVYAYAAVAAYETIRQGDTAYRSLAGQLKGLTPVPSAPGEVSFPIAGVHAYLVVGRALTFSQARMDSLRVALDNELKASGVPSDVFERSIAYGDTVAKHVLAWAGKDKFKESRGLPKYTVTNEPGRWIPTPPAYMDAVEPNWATIRAMVLDSTSQFRADPPYPFVPTRGSLFFQDMQEVYDAGRNLTDEQRAMAAFWDCNPYVMHVQGHTMFATKKISPGGHWMGIVGLAARKANADITRSAESYLRTSLALFDGFLSVWDTKYATNLVRPETTINTYLDEKWEPLLQTPPFPEYTSGHSVISTAAATVLTAQFGDNFAFADSSEITFGLPVRTFPSFNAAADEAAMSRLYGGIHYRRAIEQGQRQGRRVGEFIVARIHTRGGAQVATAAASAPAGR